MVPSIEEGRIVLIANPVSKSGRGAVAASEAARLLRERVGDGRFEMLTTAWAGHGESLARELGPDVGCVIALGGGVVANPFLSPDALRKLGFGVWLDLKPEIAYPRILRRGLPPFLAGSADPEAEFRRICREREPKFRAFAELPFGIETEEPAETVAERLASAIEKEYSK